MMVKKPGKWFGKFTIRESNNLIRVYKRSAGFAKNSMETIGFIDVDRTDLWADFTLVVVMFIRQVHPKSYTLRRGQYRCVNEVVH